MSRTRDSVRQANFNSGSLADAPSIDNTSDNILLSDIVTENRREIYLDDEDEYPFPDQMVTHGEYQYHYEDELGKETAEGLFEIRHESQLFILRKFKGPAKIDRIIDSLGPALNDAFGSEVIVHESYRPTRKGIWKFINRAESVQDLTLLFDTGEELSLFEVEDRTGREYEDLVGSYPVLSSSIVFEIPWGGSVNVVYDQGHIEVSSDQDDIYEYVVQRFERDVVAVQ